MDDITTASAIWYGPGDRLIRTSSAVSVPQPSQFYCLYFGIDPICGQSARGLLLISIQKAGMDAAEHFLHCDRVLWAY